MNPKVRPGHKGQKGSSKVPQLSRSCCRTCQPTARPRLSKTSLFAYTTTMGHARGRRLRRATWACTCVTIRDVERKGRTLSADTDKAHGSQQLQRLAHQTMLQCLWSFVQVVQCYRQRPQNKVSRRLQWTMN